VVAILLIALTSGNIAAGSTGGSEQE